MKLRLLVLTLLSITAATSSLSEEKTEYTPPEESVYKSVDDKGRVIFSDRPEGKAEKVDIHEPNIQPRTKFLPKPKKEETQQTNYDVQITSPTSGEQYGPKRRTLFIEASVSPRLKNGDQLQFFMNGEVIGSRTSSTSKSLPLTIKNRGQNTVSVGVIDTSGNTLNQSNPITFYVIRP